MAANSGAGLVAAVLALTLTAAVAFPTSLKLERSIPAKGVSLTELMARDRARHRRMLASSDAVVNFPVGGTYDPFVAGLYYTKLQLGNPAKDFYVQIDTGSDALWVSCSSCSGCPQKTGLQIPLNFFNPDSSSTSSTVSCSDEKCNQGIESSDAVCSAQTNLCSYNFQYGDGSVTQGYYVSDTLHLDTVLPGSSSGNSSAPIIFGCSTLVGGQLTKSDSAVNGILGLGQSSFSIISQLASQGITPKVFSHCLRGDSSGGGILVLGEIVEPSMVYSPLVTEQAHYNLNLQSISVNGKNLGIDSSVFAASTNGGTIIDSGTTLAYLAEAAYGPFMDAIDNFASSKSQKVPTESMYCYLIDSGSSVSDVFPQITFLFEGKGASITLQANDYLLEQETTSGTKVWCVGFMGIQGGMTILGDLVLKDKIVVYDIAGERIGWTSYDCSMSVNVSTTTNTGNTITVSAGKVDTGSSGTSSSSRVMPDNLAPWIVMLSLVYGWIVGHRNFH